MLYLIVIIADRMKDLFRPIATEPAIAPRITEPLKAIKAANAILPIRSTDE